MKREPVITPLQQGYQDFVEMYFETHPVMQNLDKYDIQAAFNAGYRLGFDNGWNNREAEAALARDLHEDMD